MIQNTKTYLEFYVLEFSLLIENTLLLIESDLDNEQQNKSFALYN